MRVSITCVFGASLVDLLEKYGVGTNSFFFEFSDLELLELDIFGRDFVEWSLKSWSRALINTP